MTRVVVADDHAVVRRGIRTLLESAAGIQVVGETGDGRTAVEMVDRSRPDIIIMDINMPELNGLEATRMIARSASGTKVLILSMHDSDELVRGVLEAGARGYVLKTDAGEELVRAVRAIEKGQVYFTPRISELLLSGYLAREAASAPASETAVLSSREREVVQLLAEGKRNKEVAATLGISVKTAETHRSHIMEKLRLKAFSDLVRYAIRNHIVEP